jgi:hypothetical protein
MTEEKRRKKNRLDRKERGKELSKKEKNGE